MLPKCNTHLVPPAMRLAGEAARDRNPKLHTWNRRDRFLLGAFLLGVVAKTMFRGLHTNTPLREDACCCYQFIVVATAITFTPTTC